MTTNNTVHTHTPTALSHTTHSQANISMEWHTVGEEERLRETERERERERVGEVVVERVRVRVGERDRELEWNVWATVLYWGP